MGLAGPEGTYHTRSSIFYAQTLDTAQALNRPKPKDLRHSRAMPSCHGD